MITLLGVIALLIVGALGSGWARPGSRFVPRACAGLVTAAAIAASGPAVLVLYSGRAIALSLPWAVPGGALTLALDPLSAFFVLPVMWLSALAACYGVGYASGSPAPRHAWPAFLSLVAGMLAVLVARDPLLFIASWEVMSLSAWALVVSDSRSTESRRAGWIYLVAAHIGSAALLLLFAILAHAAGDGAGGGALRQDTGVVPKSLLLLLGLIGFGVKAGVVPLHVWLPEAHAAAPSHVSALMSGAMVKLGLYGMLRLVVLLGPLEPEAGALWAALGLFGALLGIALALQQRDLKRVLAYSSVENLGLIHFGLGLALWGHATGARSLAAFALVGALLHIWNHAAMKGLLFFGVGTIVHATGTRDLERLGGLLRRMPVVGACSVVGAVAISGLPPLNGFGGEWLLFRGLLEGGLESSGAARMAVFLGVALLALVGGLAAVCFVRLVGIALLGEPRSSAPTAAHDPGPCMRVPVLALTALCVAFGILPAAVVSSFGFVADQVLGAGALSIRDWVEVSGSLTPIGVISAVVWIAVAAGGLWAWRLRSGFAERRETWSCGYAAPTARMQYTARSFSELLARRVFPSALGSRVRVAAPSGLFPARARLMGEEADPILHRSYEPLFDAIARRFVRVRVLQRGIAHFYLTYIVIAVLGALLWISLRAGGSAP